MKKSKDIKQWVLNKRRSVPDSKSNSRSHPENSTETMEMDIDPVLPDTDGRRPAKTVFYAKGAPFNIDERYSYVKTLGLGAYGVVCAAKDAVLNKSVAVKKVAGVFDDLTDAKRIIREIRLLCWMKHENILSIVDIDEPEDYETFNDVYIVTELMDTDMHKLLRSRHPLVDKQRKYFAYQIFRALKYIHSASILHRDLKPANVLVSETCDIKICDFGLARYVDPDDSREKDMTEYVVTRWYRAPELLLAENEYSAAIDMWSAGCLLAELYHRKPLFPGNDIKNQIEIICRILGKPTQDEIERIQNSRARSFISRIPEKKRPTWREVLPDATPSALDLINKLLQFDPRKRISAEQALAHPFLAEYRDPESEVTGAAINFDLLEPPSEDLVGPDGIRRLMWEEILKFHPGAKNREPEEARKAERKIEEVLSKSDIASGK